MVSLRLPSETVDVFANHISKLAGFTGDGLDNIIKLTFVNGFPGDVRALL